MYAKVVNGIVDALADEIPFKEIFVAKTETTDLGEFGQEEKVIKEPKLIKEVGWDYVPDDVQLGFAKQADGSFLPTQEVVEANKIKFRKEVNNERDRRITAGLPFGGNIYDFGQRGKDNIAGAASLAKFALLAGAQPGDFTWNVKDPEEKKVATPFGWITQDDQLVPLDAPTMSALGDAAAHWETVHVFSARALKDREPIPLDFKDNKYWP